MKFRKPTTKCLQNYFKTSEKPLQGIHAKANKLLQNLERNMQKPYKTLSVLMSKNLLVYVNGYHCI